MTAILAFYFVENLDLVESLCVGIPWEFVRLCAEVAIVTVAFPGAGPARIERLVARPLEEEIAEIAAVDTIDTTLRQGMAVFTIQLGDEVYDTDTAWDRVRVAMDDAARDYPAGVGEAQLDDRIIDASLMVLAVTGDAPPRILGDAAKTLRRHLLGVDGVAATELHGDPGRQVTITIDDAAMDRYGVSPAGIAADIGANNRVTRGGTLRLAGASVNLDPATDFDDIDAIRDTAIGLPDGGTLPLSALARVHQSEAVPARGALWHDGNRGVGVEIIAERGVNVVALGERLRDAQHPGGARGREGAHGRRGHARQKQPIRVQRRVARCGQKIRFQLLCKKGISGTLIDEDLTNASAALDEGHCVVAIPSRGILAEITSQGLLAPRNLRRSDDRRKGGNGSKPVGIAERHS